MKATYMKPALKAFGDIETITQATGPDPSPDFIFFNGVPVTPGPDDGEYSVFCGPTGCTTAPTP